MRKLAPDQPLLTGQRVLDTFFPVAKGGSTAIPGPLEVETVTQQRAAKWADSENCLHCCGERGNEMCDVLSSFPELEDPKSASFDGKNNFVANIKCQWLS